MSLDLSPRFHTTTLLVTADSGDGGALERLVPLLYEELRVMTHRHLARERRVDSHSASILDRSLAAFELDLGGKRTRAARMLMEVERARADDRVSYRQLADHHPFLTAVNRLTASRWLLAQGDAAAAAGLLVFHEGVPFPLPLTGHANYILAGPAYLERARIEEATGRSDVARTYYWQFLRRYDLPRPAHQPLVDEARAALARLARHKR